MSSLADIRSALADALGSVAGLSSYEVVPGQISAPAAVIAPEDIEFDMDFDGGATYRLPVQLLVSLGDWGTAQRVMDAFISHDGSATNALNDDVAGFEVRVTGARDYRLTQFGDKDYLGAVLAVEVIV